MQSLIEIKNLKHSYIDTDGNEIHALNGVSLDIYNIGANGSGKSTLARHLNALLLPTEGKCVVAGMDTADDKNLWNIRQHVGMVFQNPDNQIVAAIVEEDVAFGPENIGVPPAEIRTRVDNALAAVGMTEYAKHAPHLLSGGQKQRVAIAGVLALEPDCIVLDEPTDCKYGKKAEPRKKYYRCIYHALYGRSHAGRPHYSHGTRRNKNAGQA